MSHCRLEGGNNPSDWNSIRLRNEKCIDTVKYQVVLGTSCTIGRLQLSQCRAIPARAAVHREGLARSAAAKREGRKVSRTPRVSPPCHLHPSPLPPRYMIAALEPLPAAIIRTHKRHLLRVRHQRWPLPAASPPALHAKRAFAAL